MIPSLPRNCVQSGVFAWFCVDTQTWSRGRTFPVGFVSRHVYARRWSYTRTAYRGRSRRLEIHPTVGPARVVGPARHEKKKNVCGQESYSLRPRVVEEVQTPRPTDPRLFALPFLSTVPPTGRRSLGDPFGGGQKWEPWRSYPPQTEAPPSLPARAKVPPRPLSLWADPSRPFRPTMGRVGSGS